jgi:hypothetical protein
VAVRERDDDETSGAMTELGDLQVQRVAVALQLITSCHEVAEREASALRTRCIYGTSSHGRTRHREQLVKPAPQTSKHRKAI